MFKPGDRVRRIEKLAHFGVKFGDVVEVENPQKTGFTVKGMDQEILFSNQFFELVEEPRVKPHKHAELIKAWADGAVIQYFRNSDEQWVDIVGNPAWHRSNIYRVKPEPKSDVVISRYIFKRHIVDVCQNSTDDPNVKFIFDGETGKLKTVELLP